MEIPLELNPFVWLSDPAIRQLTFEERGVYLELLSHMVVFAVQNGVVGLPDDDAFVMRLLKIEPYRWAKFRVALIDGVGAPFYVEAGTICAPHLDVPEEWGELNGGD